MEFENIPRPEILREKSPDRFIALFKEITGMAFAGDLMDKNPQESLRSSGFRERGGIMGALIVGSSTNRESTPKDLDTILLVDNFINHYSWEYAEELRNAFDSKYTRVATGSPFPIQHGRLDILGFVVAGGEGINQLLSECIKRSPCEPLVLSFNIQDAEIIKQDVVEIRSK